jgi:hypothetical protein
MCYIWFGAYPNHMHLKKIQLDEKKKESKQKRKTQQHRLGTNV